MLDLRVCDHFGVEVAYAKIGLEELAGGLWKTVKAPGPSGKLSGNILLMEEIRLTS